MQEERERLIAINNAITATNQNIIKNIATNWILKNYALFTSKNLICVSFRVI